VLARKTGERGAELPEHWLHGDRGSRRGARPSRFRRLRQSAWSTYNAGCCLSNALPAMWSA